MTALPAIECPPSENLYPKVRLKTHDYVWIEGEECVAQSRQDKKWIFVKIETGELVIKDDLEITILRAQAKFRSHSRRTLHAALSPIAFDALEKTALTKAERKHAWVEYFKRRGDYRANKSWLFKRIRERSEEIGEESPPSPGTIINWMKLHDAHYAEMGLAAYADRHDLKGKRGSRLPAPKQEALGRAIDRYLEGLTAKDAYVEAVKYVHEFNNSAEGKAYCATAPKKHLRMGRLTPPSLSTFHREINKLSPYVCRAGRIGKHYARKHGRTFQTRALPDRPYAEVEVDFTPLDVILVAESGALLGRPHLILLVDRATKILLGFSLSFEVPSYAAVLDGLRNAMYPKSISHIDGLHDCEWPCFGRIEKLIVDNGREFVNDQLLSAAANLGFQIERNSPRMPWEKGLVERIMREVSRMAHLLPGTTLSNSVQRRDYENIDFPTLTLSECRDLITKWIVTVYNRRPNRMLGNAPGVGRSPIDAWRDKLNELDFASLPDTELFLALSGEREMRTVQKSGVVWDHISYWSPELDRIIAHPNHELKSSSTKTAQYLVRRDPFDLSKIYLYNHHVSEVLELPVVERWRKYATDLSKHEHALCRAHESIREEQRSDPVALWKARAELIEAGKGKLKSGRRKQIERSLVRLLCKNRAKQFDSEIDPATDLRAGGDLMPLTTVVEAPLLVPGTGKESALDPVGDIEQVEPYPPRSEEYDDMAAILELAAKTRSGSGDDA
ncbi:hypothetical protein GCM10023208_21060 [Erythrobacter westpacificensis]|uniref:Integrase catalytic domain-containing protein n=1 Tax=Erythrobacter westpacificensis TaxID=1055231 RepID=A0ABP9KGX6_9SPHN